MLRLLKVMHLPAAAFRGLVSSIPLRAGIVLSRQCRRFASEVLCRQDMTLRCGSLLLSADRHAFLVQPPQRCCCLEAVNVAPKPPGL